MSTEPPSEWDRILSQRLVRETQGLPAARPAAPQQGGRPEPTYLFDSTAFGDRAQGQPSEVSAEGSVGPLSPGVAQSQYGGITQGWAVSDNQTALDVARGPRAPLEARAAARGASSPALVVDQLRRLTPQEESRAFKILSGMGARRGSLGVVALGVGVAVAAAAGALVYAGAFRGDRELRLSEELLPPEEPALAAAAAPTGPVRSAGVSGASSAVPGPAAAAPGSAVSGPRRHAAAAAAQPNRRMAANDGPTFTLARTAKPAVWRTLSGPSPDLGGAPSVAGQSK